MHSLPPFVHEWTPVIIGVGFCQEKFDDPLSSAEPYQLMVKAIRDAVRDAGSESLSDKIVTQLESITVLKGMWEYRNPGKLIADQLGCSKAKSILADVGNLQLSALFELCQAIENGEQHMGVVVGGEAKYRELRAKITGQQVNTTQQADDTPAPDEYVGIPDPFASDVEAAAGMFMPVELFSVIESALRKHQGLSVDAHRTHIATLYSEYSKVAANNPRAWSRDVIAVNDIRNASEKNAMLAFPYTKRFNSQWNVNQSAAILVCSAGKAKELGLDNEHWIYPIVGVQNRHVVCLAQKKQLHSQPGAVMTGERAYALAGITAKEVTAADLYSCFPSAIQTFGQDLNIHHIPWSVSGSMAFAGGPYNHASLDSVVRIVDVLRDKSKKGRQIGIVSNLSGIFGKEAVALFSNEPNHSLSEAKGFCFEDITEDVAKIDVPLPTDINYHGAATIVAYTVVFNKEGPSHAFAYCDTTNGARTVAKSLDKELLKKMTEEEFIGRNVIVREDKTFVST